MRVTNPVRTCPVCTKTDDHPRHVHDTGRFTLALHMDCCAIAYDCEVCAAQLDGVGGVEGNPKGDALRDHLVTTSTAPDAPGWSPPTEI